jgi:hypothetical protein
LSKALRGQDTDIRDLVYLGGHGAVPHRWGVRNYLDAADPYAEATAGIARVHLRSDELGTAANAAMSLALGLVEGTTPTLGAGGGILVRGGPILFDVGYRYKQLFAEGLTRLALGFGQPLRTHQARVGIGIRF